MMDADSVRADCIGIQLIIKRASCDKSSMCEGTRGVDRLSASVQSSARPTSGTRLHLSTTHGRRSGEHDRSVLYQDARSTCYGRRFLSTRTAQRRPTAMMLLRYFDLHTCCTSIGAVKQGAEP